MSAKTKTVTVESLSTDKRTVNAKIRQVATTGKDFIFAVHDAGCHVCAVILDEIANDTMPNVDRVRATLLNMPKGTRRQAMAEWFKLVLPITIAFNSDNTDVSVTMLKGKQAKKFDGQSLEWACANVFEDVVKPEKQPQPYNPLSRLQAWLKQTHKGLDGERDMALPDGASEELVARLIAANEEILKKEGLLA